MDKWHVDQAYAEFQKKKIEINSQGQNLNEATTRMRTIDTILFDILGWDKGDVDTEKYCRAEGYADYVVGHDKKPCLTIEAKREGLSFLLKNTEYRNTPYTFGLLGKDCKDAMDALQQASGYAVTLGCRYIAITNG